MKLLTTNARVNHRDPFGQGLDAVITLVVFLAAGFFFDRWLGTTPWVMIGLTVVAAVGVFYRLKNGYLAKMAAYDAERAATRAGSTPDRPAMPESRGTPAP
ncbi:MAG: AtpZ/AtpI family protein [Thermoleophilaceae bacterium]